MAASPLPGGGRAERRELLTARGVLQPAKAPGLREMELEGGGSPRPRRRARMAGDLWGSGCQLLKVHRLGRQRSLPLLC